MIDALVSPFIEFSFMRRALVGCMAISLTAPPIGVFLVLRRMSLMGDAMGHALLPGAARIRMLRWGTGVRVPPSGTYGSRILCTSSAEAKRSGITRIT